MTTASDALATVPTPAKPSFLSRAIARMKAARMKVVDAEDRGLLALASSTKSDATGAIEMPSASKWGLPIAFLSLAVGAMLSSYGKKKEQEREVKAAIDSGDSMKARELLRRYFGSTLKEAAQNVTGREALADRTLDTIIDGPVFDRLVNEFDWSGSKKLETVLADEAKETAKRIKDQAGPVDFTALQTRTDDLLAKGMVARAIDVVRNELGEGKEATSEEVDRAVGGMVAQLIENGQEQKALEALALRWGTRLRNRALIETRRRNPADDVVADDTAQAVLEERAVERMKKDLELVREGKVLSLLAGDIRSIGSRERDRRKRHGLVGVPREERRRDGMLTVPTEKDSGESLLDEALPPSDREMRAVEAKELYERGVEAGVPNAVMQIIAAEDEAEVLDKKAEELSARIGVTRRVAREVLEEEKEKAETKLREGIQQVEDAPMAPLPRALVDHQKALYRRMIFMNEKKQFMEKAGLHDVASELDGEISFLRKANRATYPSDDMYRRVRAEALGELNREEEALRRDNQSSWRAYLRDAFMPRKDVRKLEQEIEDIRRVRDAREESYGLHRPGGYSPDEIVLPNGDTANDFLDKYKELRPEIERLRSSSNEEDKRRYKKALDAITSIRTELGKARDAAAKKQRLAVQGDTPRDKMEERHALIEIDVLDRVRTVMRAIDDDARIAGLQKKIEETAHIPPEEDPNASLARMLRMASTVLGKKIESPKDLPSPLEYEVKLVEQGVPVKEEVRILKRDRTDLGVMKEHLEGELRKYRQKIDAWKEKHGRYPTKPVQIYESYPGNTAGVRLGAQRVFKKDSASLRKAREMLAEKISEEKQVLGRDLTPEELALLESQTVGHRMQTELANVKSGRRKDNLKLEGSYSERRMWEDFWDTEKRLRSINESLERKTNRLREISKK